MEAVFCAQLWLASEQVKAAPSITAIDGRVLTRITRKTRQVEMVTSRNHRERISFMLLESPHSPVILRLPWLQQHNPQIDWRGKRITRYTTDCHALCLEMAVPPRDKRREVEEKLSDLTKIPLEYHDLAPMFCKHSTVALPPHRPYHCANQNAARGKTSIQQFV